MINFPVFDRLDISDYGVYPGADSSDPGLHIVFRPGLTLILGANGLGKTTLVTIFFRLLTGPSDIPRLEDRPELGTLRLKPARLSIKKRKTFAERVFDSAHNARALLSLQMGSHSVLLERSLHDLALTQLEIDNQAVEIKEEIYQDEMTRMAGISSLMFPRESGLGIKRDPVCGIIPFSEGYDDEGKKAGNRSDGVLFMAVNGKCW